MRISDWSSAVCSSDLAPGDGHKNDPPDEVRRVLKSNKRRGANQAIALTLLVRREYLRATVFLCSTPLATPRAISGWAACSAAAAAALSPAAAADSPSSTRVWMRDAGFLFTNFPGVVRARRVFGC